MSTFVEDDSPIIGIDLGTTYSCVAAYDYQTKKVVVLPNTGIVKFVFIKHHFNT